MSFFEEEISFEEKLDKCMHIFGMHKTIIDFDELNRFISEPPDGYEPVVNNVTGKIVIDSFILHLCIHTSVDKISYINDRYDSILDQEAYCDKVISMYNKYSSSVEEEYVEKIDGKYKIVFEYINNIVRIKTLFKMKDTLSFFTKIMRDANNISYTDLDKIDTISINRYIKYLMHYGSFVTEYMLITKRYPNKISLKDNISIYYNKVDIENYVYHFVRKNWSWLLCSIRKDRFYVRDN